MKHTTIFKKPILWFILLPLLVIPVFSLFLPMRPTAFAEILSKQYLLGSKLETIQAKIDIITNIKSLSDEQQEELKDLRIQFLNIEKELYEFGFYKVSWGYRMRKIDSPAGEAYQYFVLLLSMAFFFLVFAISRIRIPLFIRYGCLSTGTILSGISIAQWIAMILVVPTTWYAKVTGCIVVPLLLIGLITCWIFFLKKYLFKKK